MDLAQENIDRSDDEEELVKTFSGLNIVYPYGCTLRVKSPS